MIIEDGLRRMWRVVEDLIYYMTLYNETYEMPRMPDGVSDGVLKGHYRYRGPVEKWTQAPLIEMLRSCGWMRPRP